LTQRSEQCGGRLSVSCLTSLAEVEKLEDDWRTLYSEVEDALPFSSFDWFIAWWRHLRRETFWLRDSLRLYVVSQPDGKVIAIAPMMRTAAAILYVPVVRSYQFIGTDPNLTEVRGMLVRSSDESSAVQALAAMLHRRRDHDWVLWSGLRKAEDSLDSVRALWPSAAVEKETPDFVLRLPGSWEELRTRLPRNIRESLRKCYNSLARDGHEWKFNVITSGRELRPALEKLIEMHGRRAEAAGTVAHRDCFDTDARRAFIHEIVERFSRTGSVRVFQLEIANEVVATRLAFVSGNQLYLYYSGYDPAWGKYSVMTTVVAEAIKHAIENRMASLNLSTWPDESKLRWRPDEVRYLDVLCVRPSRLAAARYSLFHPQVRAKLKRILARD
jgi:CelD/BcsL family acetyltransferase involved in cellulose biosynthesis